MRQYKHCIGAECKLAKENFTAEIVFASVGIVDEADDLIEPGAVHGQVARVQPAHNWQAASIGVAKIREEDDEAKASVLFNPNMKTAREWFLSIKGNLEAGLPQGWDMGFTPIEADYELRSGRRVRVLRQIEVHEISPVLVARGVQRTLCVNCGAKAAQAQQAIVEPAKAHACSCSGKSNGAGDLAAVLAEVKALRSEVAALTAPRVRLLSHRRDFDPDFAARVLKRVADAEARASRRLMRNGFR
jgi:hypothetical protein